ncbi:MAG: hypothetical protein AAF809_03900 [Bacteroidota bacterium]
MTRTLSARHHAKRPLHLVGIDPGDVTGLAVYELRSKQLVTCESGHFFDVQDRLADYAITPQHLDRMLSSGLANLAEDWWHVAAVVIEDSRGLPVYARHDRQRGRKRDAIVRNVGRVDRDVTLWAEWLRRRGFLVALREPVRGAKWKADTLQQLTGWTTPTNEHARDAARLVWGWTEPELRAWLGQLCGSTPHPTEVVT